MSGAMLQAGGNDGKGEYYIAAHFSSPVAGLKRSSVPKMFLTIDQWLGAKKRRHRDSQAT